MLLPFRKSSSNMKKKELNEGVFMLEQAKEDYWEDIYQAKKSKELGWFQSNPIVSLELIETAGLPLHAKLIDVGGGDSLLVDYLLELGYTDLTVLDISKSALKRAKRRLGKLAHKVHWIHTDINNFEPERTYDLWHDRACFHFLTKKETVEKYVSVCTKGMRKGGIFVLGAFSKSGPVKCSGLTICQYEKEEVNTNFGSNFNIQSCFPSVHVTPSQMEQNYTYCVLKRKE